MLGFIKKNIFGVMDMITVDIIFFTAPGTSVLISVENNLANPFPPG
jgi:hypothetical protein